MIKSIWPRWSWNTEEVPVQPIETKMRTIPAPHKDKVTSAPLLNFLKYIMDNANIELKQIESDISDLELQKKVLEMQKQFTVEMITLANRYNPLISELKLQRRQAEKDSMIRATE